MTKSLRPLSLLASLALAVVARADTTLAPTSPFAPPDGVATVATENQAFELRGILTDKGGYRFSIYDPAKKSGQWVRLNESGYDFKVKAHDVARDTITLEYQGRMLTLPLHTSKVVGMAVADPSLAPRGGDGMSGVGPQPKPSGPEEAARFNRAKDEINRRRQMREKGINPGPMPLPMSGATPGGLPGPVPNPAPTNSGPGPQPK